MQTFSEVGGSDCKRAECQFWLSLPVLISLISLFSAPPVEANYIVTPGASANVEGNTSNANAFSIANDSFIPSDSQRYQQIYNSSLFSAETPGGELITQLAFRPDGLNGFAFSTTLPDMRIDLSTTKSSESGYSSVFAGNVGADDTIVYGGVAGSALPLSSADTGPTGGPKNFDIVINLTTPFFYNPANGNLLLDIRDYNGVMTTNFDAVNTVGDGIASLFTNGNGVNGTSDNVSDTIGFVTQFAFVPEPSSCCIFGLVSASVLMRRIPRPATGS